MEQTNIPGQGEEMNNNNDEPDDLIIFQDIESNEKEITDITDMEKGSNSNNSREKSKIKQNKFEAKKKYTKETIYDEENSKVDDMNHSAMKNRTVVEQSPKGRFVRFEEELGMGSHKRVYKGYDYDMGREIAWNAINVSMMPESTLDKIREEIVLMKKLKHPNIINFISGFFNEEKKEVVMITEFFSGGSLKQYLQKYKNPRLRVIKFWCKEILKGLKYLHEFDNPIIHRDIKCDNVFINKTTGQVKIGDLGLSCVLKENLCAKTFSGTIEFCAPEVFYGKYGVLADIYSFGGCLLEMITKERPYKECDGNILTVCDHVTHQIFPKSLEKIRNIRLCEFIKSCLRTESERPSANDLLESVFLNDLESEENNFPALMYPPENDKVERQPILKVNSCKNLQHNGRIKKVLFKSSKADLQGDKSKLPQNRLENNDKSTHKMKKSKTTGASNSKTGKQKNISSSDETNQINTRFGNKSENNITKSLFGQKQVKLQNTLNISNVNKQRSRSIGSNKIEMKIEEEEKEESIIKILLMKKGDTKQKVIRIKFTFNLTKDTCEGIVKELESEIFLTEEEKKTIKHKLSNLIRNYINMNGNQKNRENIPALNEVKDSKQYIEAKTYFDRFQKKYKKIQTAAEEILRMSQFLKEELIVSSNLDDEQEEIIKQIEALEYFVKKSK